ncbi:MAG: YitT family protein [Propionicimonas sp.]|uniref:YitT family protein n=1 Tax=Propionicimonas sp. TaxID=1955623 RepID=UPI003D0BED5F
MTARPVDAPAAVGVRHSLVEDVFGLVSGTFVASLGIYLLKSAHAVTGGTAGLSLLLSYATGWSFGVLYFLTNLPFFVLAVRAKGWDFSVRTLVSIALVSGFAYLHPLMLPETLLNPVYATLVGNLLAGVGMLMVFRHRSSLGGLNTLALIVQDKVGWRAGYVQLAMDAVIILAALSVVPLGNVALSAAGAVVLNVVLAFNHRPGRYLGY